MTSLNNLKEVYQAHGEHSNDDFDKDRLEDMVGEVIIEHDGDNDND